MSLLMKIIVSVIFILILVFIFNYIFGNPNRISAIKDATVETIISDNNLPAAANSINYTYSIWFYIEDWNYKYGEKKVILRRINNDGKSNPQITLGDYQNTIAITVDTYADSSTSTTQGEYTCTINNIPIQSWTHLLVSVNTRTIDAYLDGKLVKTCILPGVAKIDPTSNVNITPTGGFAGYTSNIQYFGDSMNPQQAWDIYVAGYGEGSYFGEIFNKYKVKVAVLEDEKEYSSFTI